MALQSSDFASVKTGLDDLTKAMRELTDVLRKGAAGPAAGGGAAGAGGLRPGGPGGAGAAYAGGSGSGAKADSANGAAAGVALGATRQLLGSSPGTGAVGALVGGLSGGPAGAFGAAAGLAGEVGRYNTGQSSREAVAGAFGSAPLNDTDRMATARANAAGKIARIDEDAKFEDRFDVSQLTEDGRKKAFERRLGREFEKREIRRQVDADVAPEERAIARTRHQLDRFAAAGGLKTEAGKRIADQFHKMFLEQENNRRDLDDWARVADARLQSNTPGHQGRAGTK